MLFEGHFGLQKCMLFKSQMFDFGGTSGLTWNKPGKLSYTHTHTHNCFMALWILSGTTWVSRYQKKHSPTHTDRGHQISLSASSIYYDPWHPPYSIHVLYSLFSQSLQLFFGLPLGLACEKKLFNSGFRSTNST